MSLTIGNIARMAGVNVETIRYYQRIGLLDRPEKPSIGFRQYPVKTVQRIQFIKRAQQLGFSLREIAELLLLGDGDCDQARILAERKRDTIESQIRDLTAMRNVLDELIACCLNERSTAHCSLIGALANQVKDPR